MRMPYLCGKNGESSWILSINSFKIFFGYPEEYSVCVTEYSSGWQERFKLYPPLSKLTLPVFGTFNGPLSETRM
jgi:hypothetical protein